jgi:hypothetical protein
MSIRLNLAFAAALAVLTLGCARQHAESIPEAARSACESEHVAAADMDACIAQMSDTIEAARAYRPEPVHPTQPAHSQPQHSGAGRGGSSHN